MWQMFSITVPYDPEGIAELNHFLRIHRVVNVVRELVTRDGVPYWVFLLEYTETGSEGDFGTRASFRGKQSQRIDYQEILSPEEFARFDALRDVRKAIGAETNSKLFTILTNAELAAIAQANPCTPEELSKVPGVNAERLAKYGKQLLAALEPLRTIASPVDTEAK